MNKAFLKILCYSLILNNSQEIISKLSFYNLHKNEVADIAINGRISELIVLLSSYSNTHLQNVLLLSVIKLLGIIAALLTLRLVVIGRKLLIISFYISILSIIINLIVDINFAYQIFAMRLYKTVTLFLITYTIQIFISVISLIFITWVLKQLKSNDIKTLFIKKSVTSL